MCVIKFVSASVRVSLDVCDSVHTQGVFAAKLPCDCTDKTLSADAVVDASPSNQQAHLPFPLF